jgi:hypothetical protein
MMTSNLGRLVLAIRHAPQPVVQDYASHLPYLIRLRFGAFGLQIQDLSDALLPENMMAASRPFAESEPMQQSSQLDKGDVRIARAR